MLIPASLSHTQQADASHIWPQYLCDLSAAPELLLTMSAVLSRPHSLNSFLKWLNVDLSGFFFFFKLVWNCKAELKVSWSGKDILFYLRFRWRYSPFLPPVARRKWNHEFDGRRGQRERERERERWVSDSLSFLSFVPLCVNTDVQPRTQHVNVIFAFQRYLHWSCVYLSGTGEGSSAANTHRQIWINSNFHKRHRSKFFF